MPSPATSTFAYNNMDTSSYRRFIESIPLRVTIDQCKNSRHINNDRRLELIYKDHITGFVGTLAEFLKVQDINQTCCLEEIGLRPFDSTAPGSPTSVTKFQYEDWCIIKKPEELEEKDGWLFLD